MSRRMRLALGAAAVVALLWYLWRRMTGPQKPTFEPGYPTTDRATPHFTWAELLGDRLAQGDDATAVLGAARIAEVIREQRGDLPFVLNVYFKQSSGGPIVLSAAKPTEVLQLSATALPGQDAESLDADWHDWIAKNAPLPADVTFYGPVVTLRRDVALQWGAANG